MEQFIFERAKSLIEAELGDELLGLNMEDGRCFGFNAGAASVWRLLETPKTVDSLVAALTAEYEVAEGQCRKDVAELLDSMTEISLIRRTSTLPQQTADTA